MAKDPDRIYIDEQDRTRYAKLGEIEEFFSTANLENKDLFMYAMACGVTNKVRRPLGSRDGYFRVNYMKPIDEALLNAVALWESGDPEVLTDKKAVYEIAEEYAHGGIILLIEVVQSIEYGSYSRILERETIERLRALKKHWAHDKGVHENGS